MSDLTRSRFGRALYEALPEIYRTRDGRRADGHKDDGEGHLAAYLDSCGKLLDAIYNSLDQRYRDCFPETCQEWLLPYFAELLGASTLSPHVKGRRKEIMNAIKWRQGKGSLTTIKNIAEEMGEFEDLAEREGWRRAARTSRVGGEFTTPAIANTRGKNPADFIGHRCEEPRSVDVRKPGWRHGHANQRAVLLYASPYPGFFAGGDAVCFKWNSKTANGSKKGDFENWKDINNWFKKEAVSADEYIGLNFDEETGDMHFFKKPGVKKTIRIAGDKTLEAPSSTTPWFQYRFTEINLDGEIGVTNGTHLTLEKLAAGKVSIVGNATSSAAIKPLQSIVDNSASGIISAGNAVLPNRPPKAAFHILEATDCLLGEISALSSLSRLVYCTVLNQATSDYLEASDCIFTGIITEDINNKKETKNERIRYCRHSQEDRFGGFVGNTTEMPVFYTKEWGEPGCGVLHPAAPKSVCNGAEDGGEMGAYHHRAYVLAWEAVTRKLLDYLPAGMNAALIPDETLRKNGKTS